MPQPKTPNGKVAPQLARQAALAIGRWRSSDREGVTDREAFDRLRALEAEVTFHPSGDQAGALFQLAVLTVILERTHEEDAASRAASRLISHLVRYIEGSAAGTAELLGFNGYYFSR